MKQKGGKKMSSRMTATMPVLVIPSHSQHPTCTWQICKYVTRNYVDGNRDDIHDGTSLAVQPTASMRDTCAARKAG